MFYKKETSTWPLKILKQFGSVLYKRMELSNCVLFSETSFYH